MEPLLINVSINGKRRNSSKRVKSDSRGGGGGRGSLLDKLAAIREILLFLLACEILIKKPSPPHPSHFCGKMFCSNAVPGADISSTLMKIAASAAASIFTGTVGPARPHPDAAH